MIEVNYRIILYLFIQKLFFFAVFIFSINRKTTNDFLKIYQNFIVRASFMRRKES